MLSIGLISFATPWALAAIAALPLVWLLLRLTPPSVRQISFPAVRLLFDLVPTRRTAAHTPPWLLILRLAILLLALLGLADPVLNNHQNKDQGPVVLAIDNGWGAATAWDARIAAARTLLESADRRNQSALLVTTAVTPAGDDTPLHFLPAREVLSRVAQLAPEPWPTDRSVVAARLNDLAAQDATVTWFSDGVDSPGATEFATALQRFGKLTVIEPGTLITPLIQYAPERVIGGGGTAKAAPSTGISLKLGRVATADAPRISQGVRAMDAEGQVLARAEIIFAAGAASGTTSMDIPAELANRVTRFDVEGAATAAATILVDDQWQRRPVGIASAGAKGITAPLLEDAYYLREALQPFADTRSGTLEELLSQPMAVLVMADSGKILDNEVPRVSTWIEQGGVLVRFAGPRLDGNVDSLLPVKLRTGGRTFGGAMSWSTPAALAPFPDTSPFKGLIVADDVTVSSQVLADPTPELSNRTWARLADGTPLVTAERRGEGWVVLFHVTATPEWSKLPLSGLFMDMLRRIVDVSQGVPADSADDTAGTLAPYAVLDGRGRLSPPSPTLKPVAAQEFAALKAGPATPPGLYGLPGATRALNVSAHLDDPQPLTAIPASATRITLDGLARERAFKPWLLSIALLLLFADLIISFILRRLVPPSLMLAKTGAASIVIFLALACAHDVYAADTRAPSPGPTDFDAVLRAAILETRLAYVATGMPDVDRVAASGLQELTRVLSYRTAAELGQPTRLDLTASTLVPDTLIPYPIIYWRVTANQSLPPARALSALNNYMHRGGMVIFDAPDQAGALGGSASGGIRQRLDQILRSLDIPPMTALGDGHVLNRSFYLTHGLPGRYTSGDVMVERNSTANDGVSSVIIGGNDWAAAWARDTNGLPLYAAVPGGEQQREMAYRAGVNLVMYALTGNYKADLVHTPAIQQRLTQ